MSFCMCVCAIPLTQVSKILFSQLNNTKLMKYRNNQLNSLSGSWDGMALTGPDFVEWALINTSNLCLWWKLGTWTNTQIAGIVVPSHFLYLKYFFFILWNLFENICSKHNAIQSPWAISWKITVSTGGKTYMKIFFFFIYDNK